MVKLYLRYQQERCVGVVASQGANSLFSHDGRLCIVPALQDIRLWDIRRGDLVATWTEAAIRGQITCLARGPTSPDGTPNHLFAAGYSDGSIRVWDATTNECVVTFQGHRSAVSALRFDATSQRLASGARDTDIIVWDLVEQCGLYRLRGHKDQITALRFLSRNGLDHIISSSKDALIKVWDLKIQHCVETIMAHRGEVWALEVFPNESHILSGAADGEVAMWSLDSSFLVSNIEDTAKNSEDVSQLGERRAVKQVGLLDRLGKERIVTIAMHTTTTGEYIAVQGTDKAVELFQVLSEQEIKHKIARKRRRRREKERKNEEKAKDNKSSQKKSKETTDTHSSDEDEDDKAMDVVIASDEEDDDKDNKLDDIRLTTAEKIPRVAIIRCSARVRSFDFSPQKQTKASNLSIMCALTNNSIETFLVDPHNSEEPTRLISTLDSEGHRTDVRAVALSSTDELMLSGSSELVKVWNVKTGKCIKTFDSGAVLCAEFLPGNNYCVVGTRTGELQLFDLARSTMLEAIQAHSGPVWGMQMRPDRKGFVTGSRDKEVKFFDLTLIDDDETGEKRPGLVNTRTLKMNDDVLAVRFSPDGKFLAVSLLDSTVKILYADTLKFFLSLYGHKLPVVSIDISSDNLLVATASSDKTIKIWGLDFGNCHKSIIAHQEGVTNCRFVWGTHYLFSTGKDRLVKYWDMDRHEMIMKLDGHQAEVWALAVGKYGNVIVTGSNDRSIRLWEKTEDQFMLEEEREREMEEQFDEEAAADGNRYDRGIGEGQEDEQAAEEAARQAKEVAGGGEVGGAGRKTLESLKSGERLLEALLAFEEETSQLAVYRQVRRQQPNAVPPPRSPLVMEQVAAGAPEDMSPGEFVLRVVAGIKRSELEQALLLLSFANVRTLVSAVGAWVRGGGASPVGGAGDAALGVRVLVFIATVFQHELVASRTTRIMLQNTLTVLRARIGSERRAAGLTSAALRFMQRVQ